MKIVSLSESTVLILFEQTISHQVFQEVTACTQAIQDKLSLYLVDIIPSYASIHVVLNITKVSHERFKQLLRSVVDNYDDEIQGENDSKVIDIPVYYGAEVALDIALIAESASMSIDQVVEMHSSVIYDVYAIGFAPGFAYLGNVDQRIALPRKSTPRQKIAQGSLGIADKQTAIYPSTSPGGWQIVGRTPLPMVDYQTEQLTLFNVGDKVKFNPINQAEYCAMGGSLTCP